MELPAAMVFHMMLPTKELPPTYPAIQLEKSLNLHDKNGGDVMAREA